MEDLQEKFFQYATRRYEDASLESGRAAVYRELVFFRFNETLRNSFPLLLKFAGEEKFRELVLAFIKNEPATPYIWKSPFEFRKFCLKAKLLSDLPAAKPLMEYELAELELLMGKYSVTESVKFLWNGNYRLSDSVRLMRLPYAFHRRDFNSKGKYLLILYYDFSENRVQFIESSEFMFSFIMKLKKHNSTEALKIVCLKYGLGSNEASSVLEPVLKSYCAKKILVSTNPCQVL